MRPRAAQIVVVDWRDGRPKEADKRRPAVVVADAELLEPRFSDVLLVPWAADLDFAIPARSVAIDPTPENGCSGPCRALAHGVTATFERRARPTDATIRSAPLDQRRHPIGVALGLC